MNTIISPVNIEDRKKLGIQAGDTVRVWQKIQEGDKTRLQAFEGVVLARKHGNESGATFTVRKVSSGVGVEKIFPLFSPMIDKIEIVRRAKVRRSKLYHIRDKAAKEIRRQMRNMAMVDISTESDMEQKAKAEGALTEEEAKVDLPTQTGKTPQIREAEQKTESEKEEPKEAENIAEAKEEKPSEETNNNNEDSKSQNDEQSKKSEK